MAIPFSWSGNFYAEFLLRPLPASPSVAESSIASKTSWKKHLSLVDPAGSLSFTGVESLQVAIISSFDVAMNVS